MAYRFRYTGDYYVSPTGDDSNSGTSPDAPFATIQAAMDAKGNTTTATTIVIGTGIYYEAVSTINTSNSNTNLTIQGDGVVIINGEGISEDANNCALGNGGSTLRYVKVNDVTFTNWHNVFLDPNGGGNMLGFEANRCKFINNFDFNRSDGNTWYITDCIFVKQNFYYGNNHGGSHWRRCKFFKSVVNADDPYGSADQRTTNSPYNSGYFAKEMSDCLFANPFDNEEYIAINFHKWNHNRNHNITFTNNVFSAECKINSTKNAYQAGTRWGADITERNDVTHPFTQSAQEFVDELNTYGTWLAWDGEPGPLPQSITLGSKGKYLSKVINWNGSELTGSTALENTFGTPYSLTFNNDNYYEAAEHPPTRVLTYEHPAYGYGTANTGSNVFHTAGGATWENIIETGSGFTLSSSAIPSGTIESAVIDQGISRTIQDVQFNWSADSSTNSSAISYYTGSQGGPGTLYTYQMRYGDSSDLSSNEYKIFPLNETPYLDTNESGSGDINFITGSTDSVKGRYLQFKLTLRTDWNG
jgi:hypothetical protein